MRIHLLHDRKGHIVAAGVAAAGVHVALAPKPRQRLQSSTVETTDLEYPEHHTRLRDIATQFTVRLTDDGPILQRVRKRAARSRKSRG
jgi:hypothetical protein